MTTASTRRPLPIIRDEQLESQPLIAVLDAVLALGRGEVMLHGVSRAVFIAWAGTHGLTVEVSDDSVSRTTRVLHRTGGTLVWNWEARS